MKDFFPERLRIARGSYSQQQAADKLGIKQQSYARYESGKITPGIDVLHRICCIFKVSSDWLLGLTDDSHLGRGAVVTASQSSVAIHGHANTVNGCRDCPLMKAATSMLTDKKQKRKH
jgi:transcriptional regulator with XRE-family HTH domain